MDNSKNEEFKPIMELGYQIQKTLGKGSFGTVVLATSPLTNQYVAIKYLREVTNCKTKAKSTLHEIFLLRKLSKISRNSFTNNLLDIIEHEEDG